MLRVSFCPPKRTLQLTSDENASPAQTGFAVDSYLLTSKYDIVDDGDKLPDNLIGRIRPVVEVHLEVIISSLEEVLLVVATVRCSHKSDQHSSQLVIQSDDQTDALF